MNLTSPHAKFLNSADQNGVIRISRQTYSGRSLGGKAIEMAYRLKDMGALTLESVEFRNTAKCAAKDHTFVITDAGRSALVERTRLSALIEDLINEVA
jgi:hypothetical protein